MKQLKALAACALALMLGGCFFSPKQPVQKSLTWDPKAAKPPRRVAPVETRVPVLVDERLPRASSVAARPAAPKPPPVQVARVAPPAASVAAAESVSGASSSGTSASAPTRDGETAAVLPPKLPTVLYFEVDHYQVAPQYRELLQQHAAALKAEPERQVLVRGHADALGPADYNLALADKRAEMVMRSLAAMGVSEKQMRREAVAAAPGRRPQASARRVELVYQDPAIAGR